jgi:hypothetical protein
MRGITLKKGRKIGSYRSAMMFDVSSVTELQEAYLNRKKAPDSDDAN